MVLIANIVDDDTIKNITVLRLLQNRIMSNHQQLGN